MEAISGRKTIQEIAADHSIHPIQVSQWKRQLLDGASELFNRGKKAKGKGEGLAKEAELFQQYCFAEAWRLRAIADGAGVAQKKSQLL